MKSIRLISLSLLLFIGIGYVNSAPIADIPVKIFDSMKVGNATELAKHFNSSVEIVIFDEEKIYSRQQAEQVLRRFFNANKVESFVVLHQGGRDGAKYAIGNLVTESKSFRVYFLVKSSSGRQLIHQMRIEEE